MKTEQASVRDRLLMEKLGLVERCVNSFLGRRPWLWKNPGFDRDDLIQAARLKVLEVFQSTDLSSVTNLDAYLRTCIERGLKKAVDDMGNSVVSASRASTIRRFLAIRSELRMKLHREPEEEEIASAMSCALRTVRHLTGDLDVYGVLRSLDAPLREDQEGTLLDVLPAPETPSDEVTERPSTLKLLAQSTLDQAGVTDVEAAALKLRMGTDDSSPCLPPEIAVLQKTSRVTAARRVATAKEKILCFTLKEKQGSLDGRTARSLKQAKNVQAWSRGADCWKAVVTQANDKWRTADFVAFVANFFGYSPLELRRVGKGPSQVAFARTMLMGLLYHVGGRRQHQVARVCRVTTINVAQHLTKFRRRLRAFGVQLPDVRTLLQNEKKTPGHVVISRDLKWGGELIAAVDTTTTVVRFQSFPFRWILKELLKRAPNLREVQIAPCFEASVNRQLRAKFLRRGITLQFKYFTYRSSWSKGENRSPHYDRQRTYLLNLRGKQLARFIHLLEAKNRAAEMTARYFCVDCLTTENYVPYWQIAKMFGLSARNQHYISAQIQAVLYYVGYGLTPSQAVRWYAERLEGQVRRALQRAENKRIAAVHQEREDSRRRCLKLELGIAVPPGLPWERLPVFRQLARAKKDGRLRRLQSANHRLWKVLTFRFGLDASNDAKYRTLQQVADMLGVTRERVRQLETDALRKLRIR